MRKRKSSLHPGSPTPLSDYIARHGVTMYAVGHRCRIHERVVGLHAKGQCEPAFSTLLVYQEVLGIPVMAWANVPVILQRKSERWDLGAKRIRLTERQRRWQAKNIEHVRALHRGYQAKRKAAANAA